MIYTACCGLPQRQHRDASPVSEEKNRTSWSAYAVPFLSNSVNTFWKMSRNAAGDSAVRVNRTTDIPGAGNGSMNSWPFSFVCYGGYCLTLGVKPDYENQVFPGGMSLFRSSNGLVAIATHGNGVYSTYYKPSSGINEHGGSSGLSHRNAVSGSVSRCRKPADQDPEP